MMQVDVGVVADARVNTSKHRSHNEVAKGGGAVDVD